MKQEHGKSAGFMSEHEIEQKFTRNIPKVKQSQTYGLDIWFKAHDHHPKTLDHMDLIGELSCDLLADVYMKWLITTPSRSNPTGLLPKGYMSTQEEMNYLHLFRSQNEFVYFAAMPLFGTSDTVRIIMTEAHPLLFGVYWVETSQVENPSLNTDAKRNEFILKDLQGIRDISVTFDTEPVYGCTVIRNEPLEITNVPSDNILGIPPERLVKNNYTIKLHHGGMWLLLRKENFSSGDHKIVFKSTAINYEMEGKLWISALV
jgi:hypothetical protein